MCKGGGGARRDPVTNVNFKDANDYAQWLSQKTGRRFRLPSEAEWEYAARAGTQTTWWWGDEPDPKQANCSACGRPRKQDRTGPVGRFPPNPWGLHDTAGNVWEWTQDCRHASYAGAPANGSAWEDTDGGDCGLRVVRGGSWGDPIESARSSIRDPRKATSRYGRVGFRLVEDIA
jgi:formylglycine-generating enzyme required for sulfatase activity